jgi:hypothetical protein
MFNLIAMTAARSKTKMFVGQKETEIDEKNIVAVFIFSLLSSHGYACVDKREAHKSNKRQYDDDYHYGKTNCMNWNCLYEEINFKYPVQRN